MATGLFWLCLFGVMLNHAFATESSDTVDNTKVETPCNMGKLEECKGQGYVILGKDIIPDLTDTELNQICQDWTSIQEPCLQELSGLCEEHNGTDPEVRKAIAQSIKELGSGRKFLCDAGNKQQYISNVRPCLEKEGAENLTLAGEECYAEYNSHTWFLNRWEKMNTFEFCKHANLYLSCQDDLMDKKCGKTTTKWVSEYHLQLWMAHMNSIDCRREKAGLESGAIATITLCAGGAIFCVVLSSAALLKESGKCSKKSKTGYQQADTESK